MVSSFLRRLQVDIYTLPCKISAVPKPRPKPKRPPELAGFSEQALARLWRDRAARAGLLRAQHGALLRVIYPGRPGTSAGPDFRDALLYVEGVGLTRGDVELHLKQSDWRSHGHHRDHRYNSVTLHVVYDTEDAPTPLANGSEAPVLCVRSLLDSPPSGTPPPYLWRLLEMCGYPEPATQEDLASLLDKAGDARFTGKVQAFQQQLSHEDPEQVLYAALMEGLGYSQNRTPFIELAQRVPMALLRERALHLPAARQSPVIESCLLEASGFSSIPPSDIPPAEEALAPAPIQPPLRWNLFRVRPGNHPRKRILGAALLLQQHLENGLPSGMTGLILQGIPALERSMTIRRDGRALIGPGRARELAVNAVLPFAVAWAGAQGDSSLAEASTALYHRYPKAAGNEVQREMAELLIPSQWRSTINGARRQQGLLHLQRLLAQSDFRPES